MPDEFGVREAGRQIADSGLADDVRRKGSTNREQAARGGADDADDRDYDDRRSSRRDERNERKDRRRGDDDDRPRSRRQEEPDEEEYGDDRADYDEDDRQDDEDDDATSNREDGEDGDDDHEDDDDADGDDRNRREKLFTVKVNGETLRVPESELVAGYSRTKDYHQKTQKVAEVSRNLQAAHAQVAQRYARRLQEVNGVFAGIERMLVGDIDGPEMRELRVKDNTAWLVAREDYNSRISQVRAVIQTLQQEQERHRNDYAQTQAQNGGALVETEAARLMEHIPDWLEGRNGKPSGVKRLAEYLDRTGFAREEYAGITDHRMLLIADKARRYDELMARRKELPARNSKPTPKRIATGKTGVSSGRQLQDRQGSNEYRRARDRAAKTGDMRDAGNAINSLLTREARRESRRR